MSGSRIGFSFLRSSRVKLELKPMWSSSPFLLYKPSSSEPTSSVGRFLGSAVFEVADLELVDLESAAAPSEFFPRAQRKPPTTQSAVRMRLILTIPVRSPDIYSQSRRLATTQSHPLAAPSRIHFSAVAKPALAGESMLRDFASVEVAFASALDRDFLLLWFGGS